MILVTGGAGYIGSHTLSRLKELNEPAIALDNLYSGHRWAIPKGVELVKGNIADQALVEGLIKKHKITSVIHFAAHTAVGESVQNPFKYYRNNTLGSLNLIETCARSGVKHFIFSSTCAVYGNAASNPIRESMPTDPVSPYAASKRMTEVLLHDTEAAGFAMKSVAMRYFNVGGARVAGGLGQATPNATQLVKVAAEVACGKRPKLLIFGTDYPTADGTCIRDYIHVDDLAEAHVQALNYLRKGGKSEIVNIGYGKGYSVMEVVKAMKKVSGVDFAIEIQPRREGDVVAVWADPAKAVSLLGWKPKLDDLDLICRTAYEWERAYQPS
ncbi:MAG TPA: UDP-glucose 4-epimerase GalE [Bdellovibrionota bacterium]|jgi:UDP-glucose 4-epimerase